MRSWNSLAATVTVLAVILCCGQSAARTWTDSTGKYKIEGKFIKVTDDQVAILRDDGKVVRVPLAKLSEADQQHARKLAKPTDESPFSVAGDEKKAATKAKSSPADKETQTVVSEGVGTTPDEALKDAFRNAVQQVVGAVVDAETMVKNDELIEDKILTYSNGFIKGYEEVPNSKKNESGVHRVKIKAEVERRSVVMKLKAVNITVKEVDGKSMFAEFTTKRSAIEAAVAMRKRALEGFPANVVVANAGNLKPAQQGADAVQLSYELTVTVDTVKFDQFQQRLTPLLDKTASAAGDISLVTHRLEYLTKRDNPKQQDDFRGSFARFYLADPASQSALLGNGGNTVFSAPVICRLPDSAISTGQYPGTTGWGRDWWKGFDPSKRIVAVVNVGRNKANDRTIWKWYQVDSPFGMKFSGLAVNVSFLAADGAEITRDRLELKHPPGIIIEESTNPTQPRRPILVRLSPYFWEDGTAYAPFVVLNMAIRLTSEEIKRIASVRCGVTSSQSNGMEE